MKREKNKNKNVIDILYRCIVSYIKEIYIEKVREEKDW